MKDCSQQYNEVIGTYCCSKFIKKKELLQRRAGGPLRFLHDLFWRH